MSDEFCFLTRRKEFYRRTAFFMDRKMHFETNCSKTKHPTNKMSVGF